ncbi:hypothetical protein ELQ36_09105 [Methylococcus capsulatus]|nr:hypothetical protein [Methylococcus capsulatus]
MAAFCPATGSSPASPCIWRQTSVAALAPASLASASPTTAPTRPPAGPASDAPMAVPAAIPAASPAFSPAFRLTALAMSPRCFPASICGSAASGCKASWVRS